MDALATIEKIPSYAPGVLATAYFYALGSMQFFIIFSRFPNFFGIFALQFTIHSQKLPLPLPFIRLWQKAHHQVFEPYPSCSLLDLLLN